MAIEFEDNSMKIVELLREAAAAFAEEAGSLVQKSVRRNSRVDTGDTKGSYDYQVSEAEDGVTVTVGSPLQNAIWEEFGTGEYALNGDGRKGGWVYKSKKDGKFYYTDGKKPNRPLSRAFNTTKPKLNKALTAKIKERIG